MNDLRVRLLDSSVFSPDGHQLWCGATRNGYGRVLVGGKNRLVHRVAWEVERGPIPDGMVIDHVCRTRNCFRVEHLRLVTKRQNCTENSTGQAARNVAKELCPKCAGEYSQKNDGKRVCVPCRNSYRRQRRSLSGGGN